MYINIYVRGCWIYDLEMINVILNNQIKVITQPAVWYFDVIYHFKFVIILVIRQVDFDQNGLVVFWVVSGQTS